MSTIDTVLSQVPTKQPHGRDKAQADGDGKGQGKFADAFASVSANGTASGTADHLSIANRTVSAEAAGSEGGRPARTIGHKPAGSHRVGGFPALSDAARSLEDATDADAADGRERSMSDVRLETSRTDEQPHEAETLNPDQAADGARTGSTGAVSTGETPGYDNLLSMLTSKASSEFVPSNAVASAESLGAAVAALAQVSQGGKGAAAGRSEDIAKRAADTTNGGKMDAASRSGMAADGLVEADALSSETADADQIFRLVRADGKAKPVEIAISGNGEVSAVKEQAGPKFEAVTVVDSRRYLGLAQTGNSAAVTAAIAQDPSWAAALSDVADKAPDMTGKVVNTLKIQLHPIDLGTVTATLRLQGEALVVDLKVETGKAYRNLSEDQDAIVKALRGHGFSVDQISVQLTSSSDRSGGAGQGDAQAQFSGQQQAREGGGGRQGSGGPSYAGFMDPNEGSNHEYGQADNSAGAGKRLGTGGVYL